MRGHDVSVASNIARANEFYKPGIFDVIIVDYELPDGTGLDFLAQIGEVGGSCRVLLWSGLDRSREVAEAGVFVDRFFSKGNPHALIDYLEEAEL